MAVLGILRYPDERLHRVAAPIGRVDAAVRRLIDDLAETMYAAPGVGLAATQVDVHKQIIVVDVSSTRDELHAFINPVLSRQEGEVEREEGCLSLPGIFEKIKRAERIRVEALDRNGEPFSLDADGLLAVCIQHEMDHLKGKVFIEYLSQLKQSRIRSRLRKQLRETV
jgi:peptide deformylase